MQLGALIAIVARLLAVIAHNVREIFDTFWHPLVLWTRHGGIGPADRHSPTLYVECVSVIPRCMALFCLFDIVVVSSSLRLSLVIQNIVGPAALLALGLFSLKDLQFHCELLELVPNDKQILLFEYRLLYH